MRVLLVGASGFVGRHVRERLGGVEVAAPSRSDLDLVETPHAQIRRILEDLRPTAVVNCAGVVHGSPERLVAGNVVGVARLARAVGEVVPEARVVHVGSAAEYGAHDVPVGEGAECRPLGEYGLTKLAGTRLVAGVVRNGVVLRLFNPVGPGAPLGSLTGRLVAGMRAGGELRLGVTSDVRDFVDVRDVAEAIVAAALAPGVLPPVLNVGTGRAVAVRDLVELMIEVASWRGRVVSASEGSSALPWSCADVTAIGAVLGWKARIALRDSLADAWNEVPA
ncbi:hypothetical protein GCM10009555_055000 [Acrocarpospora macrocephala]|uniref:NAD-dependent epimerase/dehydratase domain-containing protein n=1 Tax=Acrocarpospora macrocephala TaxID=150177 RepID=A0A5M3WRA8_9ACTN|nr:NAD-dependent epimerase/dehydratase [Acrocarpospora macrocephala]GES10682.1 hypothetical protein Amac_042790 [Acrocarpospora macrocephala]